MPLYKEPSPEDVELLKSFCSHAEIAAVSRVTRFDLVDIFRAPDAVLAIYSYLGKQALSPTLAASVHHRLKFELGISKVLQVELLDSELKDKHRIKLIPGLCTDRKFISCYTRIAAAIIRPHLQKKK